MEFQGSHGERTLMLTIFSTPKPFRGHVAMTQRNALESWKRLHPDAEVILFGDEEGTAEISRELNLRHEPGVERSPLGPVRADSMFLRAQEIARHDVLCYSNCDIVLTQDFLRALERVRAWKDAFLMVGCRWDTDITDPINFSSSDWQERIVERAKTEGIQRFYHAIDYFAFPRGLYQDVPPLVVGRIWWDHWIVWKALAQGDAVVDVSEVVCAVHQNHDYSHLPGGWKTVSKDEDAQRNFMVAGGYAHLRTIEDATFRLTARGIVPNRFHWLGPTKRRIRAAGKSVRGFVRTRVWHPLLDATRTVRHSVGLRQDAAMPGFLRRKTRRHEMD